MKLFADVFNNKRVLLTGHTGFKGSWLALWLERLGARVTGVALSPESTPNHWDLLSLDLDDRRLDIRDSYAIQKVFLETKPEVVFHLAAQPLVRRSYRDPLETWSTNVMGTVNVLEACRYTNSVCAIIVVTSDKCYENKEWAWGYREIDCLGGSDPYSASKAGAEIVAASYRRAFFNGQEFPLVATARAGNVIGGGDWSEDRLIPDLVRAITASGSLEIRSPQATRPWQHVLESLSGYLVLAQNLLAGRKDFATSWNFGPEKGGNCSVEKMLEKLRRHLADTQWRLNEAPQPHEANLLYLDSAKAQSQLNWQAVWDLDVTLAKTAEWYKAWLNEQRIISQLQLAEYIDTARQSQMIWAT